MFDLAVNNATIIDGTGAPARPGAVGVCGGKIAHISTGPLTGSRIIDAGGHVLSPGFIDIHSHADFSIEAHPDAPSQLKQGVTTIVGGNCGLSPFPVFDKTELPSTASFLRPELSWNWSDLAGYRRAVAKAEPAINVALHVGHAALRLAAMGSADRAPTNAELATMCALLREAAAQGAVGFSTGLIYAPGSYADQTEIHALASAAASCGMTYSTHMRNEGDHVAAAVDEAIGAARATGVTLQISHLKAMGRLNHGSMGQLLNRIDQATHEGLDVAADVYPYTASSTTLTSRLPLWALDGGPNRLMERIGDPVPRRRIRAELATRLDAEIDPAGLVLADLPEGKYSSCVGLSISEIADRSAAEPAEVVLDVLESHRGAVTIVNHAMAESDLQEALRHPRICVASDGWILPSTGPGTPHPRSFGTFPRVLGRYVRDLEVLSLPEAVRKMTSLPASRMSLGDRGHIREGAIADLVVFDVQSVNDLSTYSDPWRLSEGVAYVVVGGHVAVENGTLARARAGALL